MELTRVGMFAFLVSACLGLDLVGRVQWNDLCPDYATLGAARAILDAGRHVGRVTGSGNFTIPDVHPGTYVLSVVSHDYVFDQLRVDVLDSASPPHIRSHVVGTPLTSDASASLRYPIVLIPRHKDNYFKPRDSFNLLGMFQNPMMIIMVLTGLAMLGMPYIMKNLDPQALEELNGQQETSANLQNTMQNGDVKSGLSALLSEEESKASVTGGRSPGNGATTQQRKTGRGSRQR